MAANTINSLVGLLDFLTEVGGVDMGTLRAELAEAGRIRQWVDDGGLGVGLGDEVVTTMPGTCSPPFAAEPVYVDAGVRGRVRDLYLDPRPRGEWLAVVVLPGQGAVSAPLQRTLTVRVDRLQLAQETARV